MKKLHFLGIAAIVVALCGCSNNSTKIQYLPCKVDKGEDWGFVNAQGEVFCKDCFKECPYPVQEGVFFVKEGDLFSLYQFDAKKPKLILEDILHIGEPHNGIMPICKKDNHIEIINTEGKSLYSLEKIDDQEVIKCASGYNSYGYLRILTMNEDGKSNYAIIDEKFNTILKPKYSYIHILGKDLFYVSSEDESQYFFINAKGEQLKQWKEIDFCSATKNGRVNIYADNTKYVCGKRDERCYIYDLNGDEILKCSEKVEDIIQIENNVFIFEGANGKGVMNFKGEKIISDKYESIYILKDGKYLAHKDDNHKYEVLNKKGELDKTLEDYDWLGPIPTFGCYAGYDNNTYYILDDNFANPNKSEFVELNYPDINTIESDYFDYNIVTGLVKNIILNELKVKNISLGNTISNLPVVKEQGVDNFSSYSRTAYVTLAKGNKFTINANIRFDEPIVKATYRNKTVQKYSYWYGYYNTTEREFDGYQFNPNAEIIGIEIASNVPSEKQEQMNKALRNMLSSLDPNRKEDLFLINGITYILSGTSINIDLY